MPPHRWRPRFYLFRTSPGAWRALCGSGRPCGQRNSNRVIFGNVNRIPVSILLSVLSLLFCPRHAAAQPVSPSPCPPSALPWQTQRPGALQHEVTNPHRLATLGDLKGWIWIRVPGKQWCKLIPGWFPQWTPDGQRFFYFLGVGYNGPQSELWSAGADGADRLRQSNAEFMTESTPIFSPDASRLAWYHQTDIASGSFEQIVVFDVRYYDRPPEVVYQVQEVDFKSQVDPASLRWKNAKTLEVRVNGAWVVIDATASIGKELP
jgi:hypothetical protein